MNTAAVIILLFIVFLGAALFGSLFPLVAQSYFEGNQFSIILGVGNTLTSGILLSAALVHQLAEAGEVLEGSYPVASLICGMSFLGLLLCEEIAHMFISTSKTEKSDIETDFTEKNDIELGKSEGESKHKSTDHSDQLAQHLQGSMLSAMALLLSLNAHSVIEGMFLGVSELDGATLFAILFHKILAAFALGASFVGARIPTTRHIIFALTFSLSTPFGLILGAILSNLSEDARLLGILQAIVSGTFLYISIVEIGMKQLVLFQPGESGGKTHESDTGTTLEIAKLASLIIGFGIMSALAIVA